MKVLFFLIFVLFFKRKKLLLKITKSKIHSNEIPQLFNEHIHLKYIKQYNLYYMYIFKLFYIKLLVKF